MRNQPLIKNLYVGILLIVFGLFLMIKGNFFDLSFTINGPKIIFSVVFVIVGLLIIWNYITSGK